MEAEERNLLGEYRRKVKVDGFRKGKAPDRVILQRHGDAIRADAIEAVLPRAITDALEAHEISPLGPPQLRELNYGESGPLMVKATVEVMPEFEVKGYRGLKLEKWIRPIADQDVEVALKGLLERTAELVPVEREARYGDYLLVDIIQCDASGTPLIGEKSPNRTLLVAEEGEGADVGHQLVGVSKGEDRKVVVQHGADAPDAAGTAHQHVYLVQVNEVKEKQLPTLDDEYARGLGDFEDLADLRRQVREDLEKEVEGEARRRMVGQAIEEVVRKNPIEVPESLVNRYLDGVVADHRQAAGEQQIDEGFIRQRYRDIATLQIKWQLISSRIARQESIEVGDEEVRERVDRFAESYGIGGGEAFRLFREQGRLDRVRADIQEEKVVDLLLESAKIKEKEIDLQQEPRDAPGTAASEPPGPAGAGGSLIIGPAGAGAEEGGEEERSEEGGSGLIIPGR